MSANAGGATALIVCAALAGFPVRALAQDRPPTAPPAASQPSSMQVTQLEGGWLAAPDVKVTRVDDRAATLAGGYTGWVTDGAFLVGAGGYWLANGSADREMAYGGLVLEWFARTDKRIRFGVRTLVGGGRATIGLSYPDLLGPEASVALEDAPIRFGHRDPRGRRPGVDRGDLTNRTLRVTETFLTAEPQANVLLTLTHWMRINAGVGYRLIGGTSLLDDRLQGVSGTVAVQFGGGR